MACLDPESAAAYASNSVLPDERARIEAHIDTCATCRELVSLLAKTAWTTTFAQQTPPTVNERRAKPADATPVLQRGTMVGPYELRHTLGAGGMGLVYAAHDARLDRLIALKCVADRHGNAELLRNEARMMARLAHPNVVPVYDLVEAHEQVFIAMELVTGRTLRQWMDAKGRTWQDIVGAFIDAGAGLAAAHALGIVHGDIKPGNILVGNDGRVRVSDFGLAALASKLDDTPAVIRGTPAYFAPEQEAGQPCDAKCDQYALAVSLNEALFGALPGEPATRSLRTPRRIERVVLRGLSRAPAARYDSVAAFGAALRSARQARGRWVALGAAVTAAFVAAGFVTGTVRGEAAQCSAAAAELVPVWTADTKQRAHAAFSRAALPYSEDTFSRVSAQLELWQRSFDAARTAACEPGLRQKRSTVVLDCLKDCAREARALAAQLVDADPAVVQHAFAAAQGLTGAEQCSAAQRAPRAASGAEGDSARALIAKARAMAWAGRYRDAVPVATGAVKAAEQVHDLGLIAAAQAVLGQEQSLSGDYDHAAVTLAAAIRSAELAQEDRARALAWCDLLGLEYFRGHHDLVITLAPAALGAAERIGEVRLKTENMLTLGSSLAEKGRADEAKAVMKEAVQLRAQAFGEDDRRTASALSALANAYAMNGELDPAIEAHSRALLASEKSYGAEHPETAIVRQNLAADYLYGLHPDRAAAELMKVTAQMLAVNGPKNRELALATTDLAWSQLLMGDPKTALATFERVIETWSTAFPTHPGYAMALLGRYAAQQQLGSARAEDLALAQTLAKDLAPFDQGRVLLAAGIASGDVKTVSEARKLLDTTTLPLVRAERDRADAWLATHAKK